METKLYCFNERCLCCGRLLQECEMCENEGVCDLCQQEFNDMEIERKKRTPKSNIFRP